MREIRSQSEYLLYFRDEIDRASKLLKAENGSVNENAAESNPAYDTWVDQAYKQALDIRKFEIELYWKRAGYFWTLIVAAFTGFFALAARAPHSKLVFLTTCIGLVLSLGWYLVNRGSKYWQENWERHVAVLEDLQAGPLYKTTLSLEEFRRARLWSGYPYSVSRVNQILSFFVVCVWCGLAVFSFPAAGDWSKWSWLAPFIAAVGTLIAILLLLWKGQSRPTSGSRPVNFTVSALPETKPREVELGGPSLPVGVTGSRGENDPHLPKRP